MGRVWVGRASAVGATVAIAASGCALVAGIETFETVDVASEAGVVGAPDAVAEGGGPCTGFVCGTACAQRGDPAFGCDESNACRPCPALANTEAICAGTTCATRCRDGFLDCNGVASDGCEVDSRSDPRHCGACAAACSDGGLPFTAHGVPACEQGKCLNRCATGYGDCNANLADGCETAINGSDVSHCGSCNPCPARASSTASCSAGACQYSCTSGFANCDGADANGCECNLSTNKCSGAACVPCAPVGGNCTVDGDCCGGGSTTTCAASSARCAAIQPG